MRPLDRIPSIKLKLAIVIVAVVGISGLVSTIGFRTGIPIWWRPPISIGIALLVVYPFARGVTSPLRELVKATKGMARGDYDVPITRTSRDEVGELARAFEAMRAQLAEADRQRKDLIANVSHELRTPLAGLQAKLENIADGVEPADPDNIATALAEIERLTVLVHQLLDLSRLEAGASPLHVETFALAPVLEGSAERVRRSHDQPDVNVEVDHDLTYTGDEGRVTQVVTNLLTNAARYAREPKQIDLAARRAGNATRGVVIVVADNGPGIAPDERERVFERFYRSDHARTSDRGGTGLGLAIVRWIVDLHGGAIRIDSNEPTGCRVVVTLPDLEEASP